MRKKGGNFEENRSVQENRPLSFDSLEEGRRGGNDRYSERSAPLPVISDPRPGGERRRNQRNREPSDFEEPVEQAALEGADHRQGQRNEMLWGRQRKSAKVALCDIQIRSLLNKDVLILYLEIKECSRQILEAEQAGFHKISRDANGIKLQITQVGSILNILSWKQAESQLMEAKPRIEKEQQSHQALIDKLIVRKAYAWRDVVNNIQNLTAFALPANMVITPKRLMKLFTTLEGLWPESTNARQRKFYKGQSPEQLKKDIRELERELQDREEYIRHFPSLLEKDIGMINFDVSENTRKRLEDAMHMLIIGREREIKLHEQIINLQRFRTATKGTILPKISDKHQGAAENKQIEKAQSEGQKNHRLRPKEQNKKTRLQQKVAQLIGRQHAKYQQLSELVLNIPSEEFQSSVRTVMGKLRYSHADLVNRKDIAEARLLEYHLEKLDGIGPDDVVNERKSAVRQKNELIHQLERLTEFESQNIQKELRQRDLALIAEVTELMAALNQTMPKDPFREESDTDQRLNEFNKKRFYGLLIKFITMIKTLINECTAGLRGDISTAKSTWKIKNEKIQMNLSKVEMLSIDYSRFALTFERLLSEAKSLAQQQQSVPQFDIQSLRKGQDLHRHVSAQLEAADSILIEAERLYHEAQSWQIRPYGLL